MIIIGIFKLIDLLQVRQTRFFLTNVRLKGYIPLGEIVNFCLFIFTLNERDQERIKGTEKASPIHTLFPR